MCSSAAHETSSHAGLRKLAASSHSAIPTTFQRARGISQPTCRIRSQFQWIPSSSCGVLSPHTIIQVSHRWHLYHKAGNRARHLVELGLVDMLAPIRSGAGLRFTRGFVRAAPLSPIAQLPKLTSTFQVRHYTLLWRDAMAQVFLHSFSSAKSNHALSMLNLFGRTALQCLEAVRLTIHD